MAVYLFVGISPAESLRAEIASGLRPKAPLKQRLRERLVALATGRFVSQTVRQQLDATGQTLAAYLQRALLYIIGGAVLVWLDAGPIGAPVGALLGLGIARLLLWRRYNSWLQEVVGEAGDLVTYLQVRLHAGSTVEQAVAAVAPQLRGPLRVEWERMLAQRRSGASMRDAILRLSDRVYDRDFGAVMSQLVVYDRESVPEEPFGNLAGHLARIRQLRREYLVHRSTSSITVLTGIAVFMAIASAVAPTLYLLWVQSIGQMQL